MANLPWQNHLFKSGWLVVSWFLCFDSIQRVFHRPTAWANWLAWAPRAYLLRCHGLQYNLLINGVHWGYNPLILTLYQHLAGTSSLSFFVGGRTPWQFHNSPDEYSNEGLPIVFSVRRWDVERHHPLHAGTNGNSMEKQVLLCISLMGRGWEFLSAYS